MRKSLSGEELARFIADTLTSGSVYKKLFSLRRQRPEIAYELDEIARALKTTVDQIQEFVRRRDAGDETLDTAPREPGLL